MTVAAAPTIVSVLSRAESGFALTADEAEVLLGATGTDRERLLEIASRMRDAGLAAAGRAGVITFSKKVFLPITNLCRDRCHYCIFVDTPGKLTKKGKSLYMSEEQILTVARQGALMGCKEALFTLGDRPELRWPDARAWLDEHGYETTLDYVHAMAAAVLRETGLLPHMNPGVMSAEEMAVLRPVAPSMGMMLETTSVRLWSEKGQVHYGSPDKEPAVRLKVLEDAGLMKVPLTTGILVGIGETVRDRAESLVAIRASHDRHGHIQETIVQNFRAKPATAMRNEPDLGAIEFVTTVAVARLVMGPDARIQVPPNLSDRAELALLLRAGIDDWGGVSPLTADHVNPERPWPQLDDLAALTRDGGFELRERLTVHAPYIHDATVWIDPDLVPQVLALTDPDTFLADQSVRPSPSPGAQGQPRDFMVRTSELRSAIRQAESNPSKLRDDQYAALLTAEGADLNELAWLANDIRRYTVGEAVSFVVNRNVTSSGLAPDGVMPTDASFTLPLLGRITADAWSLGATEVCVQGVVAAQLPATSYVDMARAIKAAQPDIHLHAFRSSDIVDGASRMRLSDADFLTALREAGVDTIPGTGVKILNEPFRARIAPDDVPIARWTAIIRAAHGAGLRSTSVMVYGLGESADDRVAHLRQLARLQAETGGFTEFVPMPALTHALVAGRSETDEHRAVHAVARLMLHGQINHLQVPWTRIGFEQAAVMLQSGSDDLGGTLFDGAVAPAAGAEQGRVMTIQDVERIARSLSRPTRQRTTGYGEPSDERKAVARA